MALFPKKLLHMRRYHSPKCVVSPVGGSVVHRSSLSVCPHSFLSSLLSQDLMEQLEKQDRTIRKLKKQLKLYSKRIGEMGGKGRPLLMFVSESCCPKCRLMFRPLSSGSGSNRGSNVSRSDGGRADSSSQHSSQGERLPRDAGIQEGG